MKEEAMKHHQNTKAKEEKASEINQEETAATQEAETTPENDNLNAELKKAKEEISEVSDKYVRLVAEFDNYRKRTAKERNELIKNAGEDIIKSLLDILDDAERAETQLEKTADIESISQGIKLIFNKLKNVLAAKGLKKMETKGEEFNPELHEAITEIPAPSEQGVGKVLDEVQNGYYLNDKIIRHAKVVVGK